jgi:hypothetical protein
MIKYDNYDFRSKRRAAIRKIVAELYTIRNAQIIALENTPCNFKSSESFEEGEMIVVTLEEVIDLLADIY